MSREESDKKYEEKMPSVRVRISQELKDQIPDPKARWIRDLITEKLGSISRGLSRGSRGLSSKNNNPEYREYLLFFFRFFQENASNIEISESEREQIKNIYEVLKSE